MSLEACSYSLAGLASGSGGADHTPSMCPSPCVRAGDPLLLAVATHDRFGNAVAVAPGAIMAAANGPKGAVPFTPVEVRPVVAGNNKGPRFANYCAGSSVQRTRDGYKRL